LEHEIYRSKLSAENSFPGTVSAIIAEYSRRHARTAGTAALSACRFPVKRAAVMNEEFVVAVAGGGEAALCNTNGLFGLVNADLAPAQILRRQQCGAGAAKLCHSLFHL